MNLAIDLPVKYSDLDIGDITFCLAPLLNRQDDTGRKYMAAMDNLQKNGRQIMLDNGAWEFGASMDSQEYMDIISILEPTWAVIPDVMGSVNKRIKAADELWEGANKKFKKVHFLGLVNLQELATFHSKPWKLVSMDTKYPVKLTYATEFTDQLGYYFTQFPLDIQSLNYHVKGFKLGIESKLKKK